MRNKLARLRTGSIFGFDGAQVPAAVLPLLVLVATILLVHTQALGADEYGAGALVLNVLFLVLLPVLLFVQLMRSLLATHAVAMLYLALAVLIVALGGGFGAAALAFPVLRPEGDALQLVHVAGAGMFFLAGAVSLVRGAVSRAEQRAQLWPAIVAGVFALGASSLSSFALASGKVQALTRPNGELSTAFAIVVLVGTVGLLASSAILLSGYLRTKTALLYFFSLGLGLLALGVGLAALAASHDALFVWSRRALFYMGSCYLLIGVGAAVRAGGPPAVSGDVSLVQAFRRVALNYREIFDASNDAIVAVDRNGHALLWNEAAEKTLGLAPTTQDLYALIPGLQEVHDRRRSSDRLTLSVPREQGSEKWLDLSFTWRKRAGQWVSTVVARDVTEREKMSIALAHARDATEREVQVRTAELAETNTQLEREIEERRTAQEELAVEREVLRTLVDNIPVMIAVYDAGGTIHLINRELERVTGWTVADLETVDLLQAVYPDPELRNQVRRHMQAVGSEWRDFPIRTRSGEVRETIWANKPLPGDRRMGIGVDVTERKRKEAVILQSQRELKRLSNRLLSIQEEERRSIARELHDRTTHELLSVSFSLAGVLGSEGLPDDAAEQLRDTAAMVQRVLRDVRELSQGLRPVSIDNAGITDALTGLVHEFSEIYDDVAFEADVEVDDGQVSPGFGLVIYRVVEEALTNVVRHSDAPNAQVSLKLDAGTLELMVTDDGTGFDPQSPGIHSEGASGVGLSSMRERVEAANGVFTVASTPGGGTTVRATWAMAPEPEADA